MKKYKKQIIIALSILVVLIFAFWYGGDAPSLRGFSVDEDKTPVAAPVATESTTVTTGGTVDSSYTEEDYLVPTTTEIASTSQDQPEDSIAPVLNEAESMQDNDTKKEPQTPEASEPEVIQSQNVVSEPKNRAPVSQAPALASEVQAPQSPTYTPPAEDIAYSEKQGMDINTKTGTDEYKTEPVPVGKPVPVEPEETKVTNNKLTCTLTIRCDTILDNLQWLDPEKKELIPEDGVIFPKTTVTFYEGESVFNVLLREMKRNKIHFEYAKTPAYNSVYIEGINNIYEFDCGELSGWKYKVNDWFPNYGCSRYQLKNNDSIEIHYTCNLGADIGAKEQ